MIELVGARHTGGMFPSSFDLRRSADERELGLCGVVAVRGEICVDFGAVVMSVNTVDTVGGTSWNGVSMDRQCRDEGKQELGIHFEVAEL